MKITLINHETSKKYNVSVKDIEKTLYYLEKYEHTRIPDKKGISTYRAGGELAKKRFKENLCVNSYLILRLMEDFSMCYYKPCKK